MQLLEIEEYPMPPSLLLVFNHQLTAVQEADAIASLGVEGIISLPEVLQGLWSDIPPGLEALDGYLQPFRRWLRDAATPGDYVLIQGDFGACYLMVNCALDLGLIPIYATTRREVVEERHEDGTVRITHHFRHMSFRRYGG
jgi:hypothetical protein